MNEKSRLAEFAAQLRVRRSAIRLSLVALMSPVLALSACAGSDDEAAAGGDSIEIALVNPYKGHPFTRSTECGALREAKRLGVDLTITGATEYSVANVTQVLNAAAAAQPDGVIVPIWDPVAYLNAIRNLADTGAVVVGVNGKPEDDSNLTSYILTDEHQGGLLAAEAMLTKVESGDIVLVLENNPTNLVSKARAAGFIEEMEAAGVDVLPVQYTDEDTTKTTSIVQATLAKHPDLAGIYETNGTDSPPSVRVVEQEGKEEQVTIVGYDGRDEQVQRVKDGKIFATVAPRPDIEGEKAVRHIVHHLQGREVPASDTAPVGIVTQENVNDPKTQEIVYQKC